MDSNNYNTNQEHKDSGKDSALLHLSLSEKTIQKGLLQDIAINKKTNSIIATLNHGCKKTIISSIYPDWIKTTSIFEKQAERKGLPSEDASHILDELDNNYETILKCILEDGVSSNNNSGEKKEDLEHTTRRKDSYIKKYSRNGVPLSECIVIEGLSKFLRLVEGKPKLINKIEIGNITFYPNDTVDSQNPLPYVFTKNMLMQNKNTLYC